MQYLDSLTEQHGLTGSSLRPAATVEIMNFESETGVKLPDDYVHFIQHVGYGYEPGRCALWHHLDLARPGNLLEVSAKIEEEQAEALKAANKRSLAYPRKFLVFYDDCEGTIYGFRQSLKNYGDRIYAWDMDELKSRVVASTFNEFLDYLMEPEGFLKSASGAAGNSA